MTVKKTTLTKNEVGCFFPTVFHRISIVEMLTEIPTKIVQLIPSTFNANTIRHNLFPLQSNWILLLTDMNTISQKQPFLIVSLQLLLLYRIDLCFYQI